MIAQTIEALKDMSHAELCPLWIETFKTQPPKRLSATLMRRILAHEIQAGASRRFLKRDQKKLIKLARGNARRSAPCLVAGGRLIREWNGVAHEVEVLEKGFSWRGQTYRSLSAIAQAITGTRWSGPRFFGISTRETPA